MLYASSSNPLYEQMKLESEIIADLSHKADAREGIASFLGKRAARFNGN